MSHSSEGVTNISLSNSVKERKATMVSKLEYIGEHSKMRLFK